jgi:hypothetical protein
MRARLLLTALPVLLTGCAGIGEAVGATCVSLAASTAGEVCFRVGLAILCDDDDGDSVVDADHADDSVSAEIPPRLDEPLADVPPCRVTQLDGGVWRLVCVDGTAAEALVAPQQLVGGGGAVVDDAIDVDGLDAVHALANRRAVVGSITVRGSSLLRLELPSLQSVQGDLRIERTAHLSTLLVPSLAVVSGAVVVVHNRRLAGDVLPRLRDAGSVHIAFNDGLDGPVVDRLLALAGPPAPTSPTSPTSPGGVDPTPLDQPQAPDDPARPDEVR